MKFHHFLILAFLQGTLWHLWGIHVRDEPILFSVLGLGTAQLQFWIIYSKP